MATCSQIKSIIQAYVDDELGPSEKVILEQHVNECSACTSMLRERQRSSARLFEAYRDYRLTQSLRSSVLSHLPEMDHSSAEMEEVNWRAKHRVSWLNRAARLAPIAAVAVLTVLAFVIQMNWPDESKVNATVGVVTALSGQVRGFPADSLEGEAVAISETVGSGSALETNGDSKVLVALASGTQLKVNRRSRVKVLDERHVRLEKGEIWLDVGRDRRLFRVETQDGDITVWGTAFSVQQLNDRTVVTVQRGEVQLENDHGWRVLRRGQRCSMTVAAEPSPAERTDTAAVADWGRDLVPDAEAQAMYETFFAAVDSSQAVQGIPVFLLQVGEYDSVEITWSEPRSKSGYCDYTIYLFTEHGHSVATEGVDGEVFANERSVEIPFDASLVSNARALNVRLVPDFTTGSLEPQDVNVFGIQRGTD